MPTRIAEARLRTKNQLTLPDPIVAALHAQPGDRFLVTAEPDGTATLSPIRDSYAGALHGVYGHARDRAADLGCDRDSWER